MTARRTPKGCGAAARDRSSSSLGSAARTGRRSIADAVPGMGVQVRVAFVRQQADPSDVQRWLEDAGALVGLSAWTPKYGRFTVESVAVRK